MTTPLVVDIPHQLGREEARRRIAARTDDLARRLPGKAEVDAEWRGEDDLQLTVRAMGQTVGARVEVGDTAIRVRLDLPGMLGFMSGVIEGAVREQGIKFLSAPKMD